MKIGHRQIVLATLLLLTSCENSVDPFVDAPQEFVAVFGFLDTAADTQFVRIEPLRPALERPPPGLLNVTVTSTHLESGAVVAWRDSLVRLDDGGTGHLFYAVFPPAPGGTYRMIFRNAEGRETVAETRVPGDPALQAEPPRVGSFGEVSQSLLLEGVRRPHRLAVRYRVASLENRIPVVERVGYDRFGEPRSTGWRLEVHLARDFRDLLRRGAVSDDETTLLFLGADVDVEHLSREWELPGASPNIEGGRGFFGAVGRFSRPWMPDSAALADAGFTLP